MTVSMEMLGEQVRNLETMLAEVKVLIKDEVGRLKTEQIADLRDEIRRLDLVRKEEAARLATDQGRLWDAVRALESKESERKGGFRIVHGIWISAIGLAGAIATLFIFFHH